MAQQDVDDTWSRVRTLAGETLTTVRGNAFSVDEVGAEYLRVTPGSTGKSRPIRRAEVEAGSALARSGADVSPIRLRESGASEYNPAYVSAIVRRVLGLV